MNIAKLIPSARADFSAATEYLSTWEEAPSENIAAMQLEQCASLWADALNDVPYYRDLVSVGAAPRQIRSWADYFAIPILDRAIIRDRERDFLRISGPPDQFMQTAGSTGNPIRFGVWAKEARPQRVAKQVAWIEGGYTLGADIVLIWGHSHLLGTGWRRWLNHAKRVTKDWALGYHRANAYTLGVHDCMRIARRIVRVRPVGIIGYASALDLFGRHVGATMRDALRNAGVKFLIVTAEQPPREDTLDMLQDLFAGCTIVEEFGGVEFGQIGVRFNKKEWKTFPDLNIIEAIDSSTEAEGQDLLVTTLYPRYTPFFRYRQGDLINGARRLAQGQVVGFERLVGRAADMIVMPDGRSVHSVAFFHCIHQEPAVLNIQMVLSDHGPRLTLIVKEGVKDGFETRIRQRLRQVHPMLECAPLDYAQDLATNAAGKRRWFVDVRSNKLLK